MFYGLSNWKFLTFRNFLFSVKRYFASVDEKSKKHLQTQNEIL